MLRVSILSIMIASGVTGCASTSSESEAAACIVRPAEPQRSYCTQQYDPVCGCDDKTYSNACMARLAGVQRVQRGRCDEQPPEA